MYALPETLPYLQIHNSNTIYGDHVRIDISIDSILKLPGPPPIYKKVAFHDFPSVQPQRDAIWLDLPENAKLGSVRNSLAKLKK